MSNLVAICVGHSRKINGRFDGGAYSDYLKTNERDFNFKVATRLSQLLASNGVKSRIITDYAGSGYGSAMIDAAKQVKDCGATIAIEMHFNAASPDANGHEWLYWATSVNGKRLANCFNTAFSKRFPTIKARGTKPLTKNDRGGKFVQLVQPPAIVCEPFFGSSKSDCVQVNPDKIAEAYAEGIYAYFI